MILVNMAEEPDNYDSKVRSPGKVYLDSLPSLISVDFTNREYWRRAIPDLRKAYNSICAYTCHWIALDTGGNSADHFLPKMMSPMLAYEWKNLRYVCSRLNARKGTKTVIDPFEVQPGMFELRFPNLYVVVGDAFLENPLVRNTIVVLNLNDDIVVDSREEYVSLYASGKADIAYLAERAPFIYQEIIRMGIEREDLVKMKF